MKQNETKLPAVTENTDENTRDDIPSHSKICL